MELKIKIFAAITLASIISAYSYWLHSITAQNERTQVLVEQMKEQLDNYELNKLVDNKKVEIVTEYVEKVIEVEKKVPVYVNKVQKIFEWNDSIIIPDDLARLHNESVCSSSSNANSARCSNEGAPTNVTLGEFAAQVMKNYGICESNSVAHSSLIQWVNGTSDIINKNQN